MIGRGYDDEIEIMALEHFGETAENAGIRADRPRLAWSAGYDGLNAHPGGSNQRRMDGPAGEPEAHHADRHRHGSARS
jgi:hypothetical protein